MCEGYRKEPNRENFSLNSWWVVATEMQRVSWGTGVEAESEAGVLLDLQVEM